MARVSGSLNKDFLAGATVTAGQPVYLNTGTNKWLLALATGSALQAGVGTKYGIAMHAALNGQPLAVMVPGPNSVINPGATVTVGTIYVVSPNNPGGIAPFADLGSTNFIVILGIGASATHIDMGMTPGYVHP